MLCYSWQVSDRKCLLRGIRGHSLCQLRKKTGRQGGGCGTAGLPGGNVVTRHGGDEASARERRKAPCLAREFEHAPAALLPSHLLHQSLLAKWFTGALLLK